MLVNSADSHVLEPDGLWLENLPPSLRDRAPHSRIEGEQEILVIDRQEVRYTKPEINDAVRPPGAYEPASRLRDLDEDGVWAELLFPSVGLWCYLIEDAQLQDACARVYNEWVLDAFLRASGRFAAAAMLPTASIEASVAELERARSLGFQAFMIPATPPAARPYNSAGWEPLWAAAEAAGARIAMHVGTGSHPVVARGPGGAVINYVETFFPPQRALTHLIASGVLDRHPHLHFLFIEGGASWLPAAMERMDEAYRQHGTFVRPKLSLLPGEFVRRQVHASFQHDQAAMKTLDITGVQAILWGSDYPHLEGTWPGSQQALAEIFAGVDTGTAKAIAFDNIAALFDLTPPAA